jgi:hypothetical protein
MGDSRARFGLNRPVRAESSRSGDEPIGSYCKHHARERLMHRHMV